MKPPFLILFAIFIAFSTAFSQKIDSIKILILKEIPILENKSLGEVERMPDIKENVIYAGKKNGGYTIG